MLFRIGPVIVAWTRRPRVHGVGHLNAQQVERLACMLADATGEKVSDAYRDLAEDYAAELDALARPPFHPLQRWADAIGARWMKGAWHFPAPGQGEVMLPLDAWVERYRSSR